MLRPVAVISLVLAVTIPASAQSRHRVVGHQSDCSLGVSPRTLPFPAAGGVASVSVTEAGQCFWRPQPSADWVQVAPAGGGFSVFAFANTVTVARTATIDVGGIVVTVTQDAASPPNMIVNGTFNHDITSWSTIFSTGYGYAQWSALDADGVPTSGSALITSDQANAGYQLQQCINVTPGQTYDFGLEMRVPPGQDSAAGVAIGVYPVDVPDCGNTAYHDQVVAQLSPPAGQWTPFTGNIRIPFQSQSVFFVMGLGGAKKPPFKANFDDVYFRPREP